MGVRLPEIEHGQAVGAGRDGGCGRVGGGVAIVPARQHTAQRVEQPAHGPARAGLAGLERPLIPDHGGLERAP